MKAPLQTKSAKPDTVQSAGFGVRPFGNLAERVSRVTGVDLGRIPVEPGQTWGKRAATHQGRVALSAEATGFDVAHELAHAAQQTGRGPGLWMGAGEAERRADRAAQVVLSGGTNHVDVGRMPGAAILGAGDPYSTQAVTIPAPPPGATVKAIKDQLDARVKAGDITAYSTSGIKPGDPEELFLLNAMAVLANTQRWGSEMDLITPIGGKTDGEVTVRFDAAGKADAELVGKSGPVVAKTFATEKDAKDGLIAKYKLSKVEGEHAKTWLLDELNKVWAAWGKLSATEAAALEGYALIRTDTLKLHGESVQGITKHSDNVTVSSPTVTHTREIRFSDGTFADDARSFIGGAGDAAPASAELIIHEAGHALEGKAFDDANAVAAKDTGGANQATIDAHTAQTSANQAINGAMHGRYPRNDLAAGQPLLDELLKTEKVLQAFEKSPDSTNDIAAKAAISARDAVKKALPSGNAVLAGCTAAISAQDDYVTALGKLLTARDTATNSRSAADALKSSSGNTKRLQIFIDFVDKEGIKPPTGYAAKHWPAEPAEFYDEAFSLWKNDPTFFAKYSPKLKAWFDAGNHLQ